jgi:hypothetical protein
MADLSSVHNLCVSERGGACNDGYRREVSLSMLGPTSRFDVKTLPIPRPKLWHRGRTMALTDHLDRPLHPLSVTPVQSGTVCETRPAK